MKPRPEPKPKRRRRILSSSSSGSGSSKQQQSPIPSSTLMQSTTSGRTSRRTAKGTTTTAQAHDPNKPSTSGQLQGSSLSRSHAPSKSSHRPSGKHWSKTPGEPGHTPGEPGHTPGEPGHTPGEPGHTPGEPGHTPGEPGHTPGEPGHTPGEPGHTPGDSDSSLDSSQDSSHEDSSHLEEDESDAETRGFVSKMTRICREHNFIAVKHDAFRNHLSNKHTLKKEGEKLIAGQFDNRNKAKKFAKRNVLEGVSKHQILCKGAFRREFGRKLKNATLKMTDIIRGVEKLGHLVVDDSKMHPRVNPDLYEFPKYVPLPNLFKYVPIHEEEDLQTPESSQSEITTEGGSAEETEHDSSDPDYVEAPRAAPKVSQVKYNVKTQRIQVKLKESGHYNQYDETDEFFKGFKDSFTRRKHRRSTEGGSPPGKPMYSTDVTAFNHAAQFAHFVNTNLHEESTHPKFQSKEFLKDTLKLKAIEKLVTQYELCGVNEDTIKNKLRGVKALVEYCKNELPPGKDHTEYRGYANTIIDQINKVTKDTGKRGRNLKKLKPRMVRTKCEEVAKFFKFRESDKHKQLKAWVKGLTEEHFEHLQPTRGEEIWRSTKNNPWNDFRKAHLFCVGEILGYGCYDNGLRPDATYKMKVSEYEESLMEPESRQIEGHIFISVGEHKTGDSLGPACITATREMAEIFEKYYSVLRPKIVPADDGEAEYFILNYSGKKYDTHTADLWSSYLKLIECPKDLRVTMKQARTAIETLNLSGLILKDSNDIALVAKHMKHSRRTAQNFYDMHLLETSLDAYKKIQELIRKAVDPHVQAAIEAQDADIVQPGVPEGRSKKKKRKEAATAAVSPRKRKSATAAENAGKCLRKTLLQQEVPYAGSGEDDGLAEPREKRRKKSRVSGKDSSTGTARSTLPATSDPTDFDFPLFEVVQAISPSPATSRAPSPHKSPAPFPSPSPALEKEKKKKKKKDKEKEKEKQVAEVSPTPLPEEERGERKKKKKKAPEESEKELEPLQNKKKKRKRKQYDPAESQERRDIDTGRYHVAGQHIKDKKWPKVEVREDIEITDPDTEKTYNIGAGLFAKEDCEDKEIICHYAYHDIVSPEEFEEVRSGLREQAKASAGKKRQFEKYVSYAQEINYSYWDEEGNYKAEKKVLLAHDFGTNASCFGHLINAIPPVGSHGKCCNVTARAKMLFGEPHMLFRVKAKGGITKGTQFVTKYTNHYDWFVDEVICPTCQKVEKVNTFYELERKKAAAALAAAQANV